MEPKFWQFGRFEAVFLVPQFFAHPYKLQLAMIEREKLRETKVQNLQIERENPKEIEPCINGVYLLLPI